MADLYIPSCKALADYPAASKKMAAYLREKHGMKPFGCCRRKYKEVQKDDTVYVVCTNCEAIMRESSDSDDIRYAWDLIDEDPDFPFPDYHGQTMTIQDCWVSHDNKAMQDAVRSLLKKMNIEIVEQEENREKTTFHGKQLLAPCFKGNEELAPEKYVVKFGHMFTPMEPEEQQAVLQAHCDKITTDKVVCYCKFCKDGIDIGGKEGIHLLELLFPNTEM